MKSSTKSLLRNLLVSIVFVGMAGGFGWLFYTELTRTVENTGGVVVGEVVEVRGQAQRRYDRQTRWGSLKGTEQVYNLDAIRTSGDSGAVIVLRNRDDAGNERLDEISLGPDTYIVLDLLGETRNINFVGGDLSASGDEGLTVSAEGTVVAVDDGAVNLSREEGRQTSVTVTEGEARVNTGAGETVVDNQSVLRIDEGTGAAVREQAALAALAPKSNALLLTYGAERRVDFSWDLFADWDRPVLEVSTDPAFDEAAAPVLQVEADEAASLELEPGVWYWAVSDGPGGPSGPVNVFTVDTERPVDPVSPADRLIIPFRGDAPVVSLQWNRGWFADSYRVEMARSSAFTEVPVVRDVTGSSVLIEDLAAGTWWWRVTPGYRRGLLDAPRSPQVRSFVLEQRTGHDPVRLVSPADGARLSGLEVREGIPFRWQSQDGLVSYRIRVSRNEGFTDVVAESDGPENWRTLLPAAEPDVYWWRVDGTSTDGLPVPESAVRRFEVQPITGSVELLDPAPGETKELEPFSSHTFLWRSGVPGTARFTLERRDAEARTRIIESLVNGESFTAPLPGEGTYVWSIQILDERGRLLVESPEGRFRLRSEFRAPTLVRPRPGDSVELVGATSLELGWNPSPGADAYRVVLRGPDGSIYGRDDRVSGLEREFSLPSAASPGRYEVELTALRDNPPAGASRSSETASYGFDIGSLVAYSAAVPVSPADGARIDALTALRSGVTLSWRQDPPLGRWTVELDNGAVTRLYQTTEPRLVLEGLDAAAYTWRIRSRDSFGQEAPDSRVARFTVTDLPAPPTPRVISPSPGENIDMTGARSLVFSWDRADGAEFYDLALYVEGSDEPLLRENGLRGTAYAVENLRILDVGDFVLDLRARTEYEDVGVTRTSRAARVPFSLSVNIASEAPKILTDELQYGG